VLPDQIHEAPARVELMRLENGRHVLPPHLWCGNSLTCNG
jgi:hypothetical protein